MISDFACYDQCSVVSLSVTFVHCAQMAEDVGMISSPMTDHAKIWLTLVNDHSSPNFAPN